MMKNRLTDSGGCKCFHSLSIFKEELKRGQRGSILQGWDRQHPPSPGIRVSRGALRRHGQGRREDGQGGELMVTEDHRTAEALPSPSFSTIHCLRDVKKRNRFQNLLVKVDVNPAVIIKIFCVNGFQGGQ